MADTTFILNEPGKTLKDRFKELIKDCESFYCIVAYFYISGFYQLYEALEKTKEIKIIVGIKTDSDIVNLIQEATKNLTNSESKEEYEKLLQIEMEKSEDKLEVEKGIDKFIQWVKEGKLQIRLYPSKKLHAKIYIMTFKEGDRDKGRVITGSSNFTQSGLESNLEFNVELKNIADYDFAKKKFDELWEDSLDISKLLIEAVDNKTWYIKNINPYEFYLKFLYEYFKDELDPKDKSSVKLPSNFKRLDYQIQAALNAKRIVEGYGGVFISDVVGLGKTYIASMLASQLDGRTIVIAPPALIDEKNPGSWPNVMDFFSVSAKFFSIGKLEEAEDYIKKHKDTGNPVKNVIIDESHRFRNDLNLRYEKIMNICRGKRVILVSATPYNNYPRDILSQIRLFQSPSKSTIPGIPNIEGFFESLQKKLDNFNRKENYSEYLEIIKSNAKEIRDKVLRYIMVRRTRKEIEKYFSQDLEKNGIRFPKVEDPKCIYYELDTKENKIFEKTVELITMKLKYSRYTPLLYLISGIDPLEKQRQKNMGSFMKVLLVKRLESSFYAFRKSIDRFIDSYKKFIELYHEGYVFVSKEINKIYELLELGDDEAIQNLIDKGKAEKYKAKDFREELIKDLQEDLETLQEIKNLWEGIDRDPKLEKLLTELERNEILKDKKIIIFTESKETAEYLAHEINSRFGKIALLFHSGLSGIKEEIINNFDPGAKNKKDNYRILVSTDILSEGVNLHRSNIVINYDIPWNPTKIIQRVGRVNRVGTSFDKIYTFNFLPVEQVDKEIELKEIARSKIETFLTLLGEDAAILTEGEPVNSHELFDKLTSKKSLEDIEEYQEESDLKYLKIIENIKNNNPELFEKIKNLPKKSRLVKKMPLPRDIQPNSLITFFRKGKLIKFFLSDENSTKEIDFLTAVKFFESLPDEKTTEPIEKYLEKYYELLFKNKQKFKELVESESEELSMKKSTKELLKHLKATETRNKELTQEEKKYLYKVIDQLEEGNLPRITITKTLKEIKKLKKEEIENSSKIIEILKEKIPDTLLESYYVENTTTKNEEIEVILSLYLA